MYREMNISAENPLPDGYSMLRKGVWYDSFHCKKQTREEGKTLYIILDENKKQTGLGVPTYILQRVRVHAKATLSTRCKAVNRKDGLALDKAAAELSTQFPLLPAEDKDRVLKHGFRKHSGRVGRTTTISLKEKVFLAVNAHARHKHTNYDDLMAAGQSRPDARKLTSEDVAVVLRNWGWISQTHQASSDKPSKKVSAGSDQATVKKVSGLGRKLSSISTVVSSCIKTKRAAARPSTLEGLPTFLSNCQKAYTQRQGASTRVQRGIAAVQHKDSRKKRKIAKRAAARKPL